MYPSRFQSAPEAVINIRSNPCLDDNLLCDNSFSRTASPGDGLIQPCNQIPVKSCFGEASSIRPGPASRETDRHRGTQAATVRRRRRWSAIQVGGGSHCLCPSGEGPDADRRLAAGRQLRGGNQARLRARHRFRSRRNRLRPSTRPRACATSSSATPGSVRCHFPRGGAFSGPSNLGASLDPLRAFLHGSAVRGGCGSADRPRARPFAGARSGTGRP